MMPRPSWLMTSAAGDVHVLPIRDLREHEERRDCWCHPKLTQDPGAAVLVSHNSVDGRELVERHGVN